MIGGPLLAVSGEHWEVEEEHKGWEGRKKGGWEGEMGDENREAASRHPPILINVIE